MNDVLCPFLDSFIIVYFGNIMIISSTWEVHLLHLKQVLETLRKHHFLENIKKCEFDKKILVCVGHVTIGGELKTDPLNI